MKLFKKRCNINPIKIDKDFLIKIESEVFAIWHDLEKDIINGFREDVKLHNEEIEQKGYSYKIFTAEESKRKFSEQDIEDYIGQNQNEIISGEISYPVELPNISYKDSENEYEVSSVSDLFDLNLKDRFEFLRISVTGKENRSIDIFFSSDYMGPAIDNTVTISSLDESWALGTLEKIKSILSRNEKPFAFLYRNKFITFLAPLVSIAIVYLLSKISGTFLLQEDNFAQWVRIIIYTAVFVVSVFIFSSKWSDLFPKVTIVDVATYREKKITALWILIMSSISLSLLYDIGRAIFENAVK